MALNACNSDEQKPENKRSEAESVQSSDTVSGDVHQPTIITGTRLPIADKLDEIKEFSSLQALLSSQNDYAYCMQSDGNFEMPHYFLQFINDCEGISGGKVKVGDYWLVLGRSTSPKSEENYLVVYDAFGEAYDDILMYGVHSGAGSAGRIDTKLEGDVLITSNNFTLTDPETNRNTNGGDVQRRRFDASKGKFESVK